MAYDAYGNNNTMSQNGASGPGLSKKLVAKKNPYEFKDTSSILRDSQNQLNGLKLRNYEEERKAAESLKPIQPSGFEKAMVSGQLPGAVSNLGKSGKGMMDSIKSFSENKKDLIGKTDDMGNPLKASTKGLVNSGAGLAGAGFDMASTILDSKRDTNRQYGTSDYFAKKDMSDALGGQAAGMATNAIAGAVPGLGLALKAGQFANKLISKPDAYGVSQTGDAALTGGAILDPLGTVSKMIGRAATMKKGEHKSFGDAISNLSPVHMNNERKAEVEKLKSAQEAEELKKQEEINAHNKEIEAQKRGINSRTNETMRLQNIINNASKLYKRGGAVPVFRRGGELDLKKENVILAGPSHDDTNNTGVKNDKGLPVVHKNVKVAEIESLELVLNKKASKEVEKLKEEYQKSKNPKLLTKIGKLMETEIQENTYDYSKELLD
jgi:hypothetical protein